MLRHSGIETPKHADPIGIPRPGTLLSIVLLGALFLWSVVATARASTTNYLNFDSVDASQGFVDATAYLSNFGITLANVSPAGSVMIADDRVFSQGACVTASSPHGFLFQSSAGPTPCSFTLVFSTPLQNITFTRCAESEACSTPKWTATAYADSTLVDSTGVCCTNSDSGQPASTYTLNGPGITSLTITSEDDSGLALDDFYLIGGCSDVGFSATNWPDASVGDAYVQPILADTATDMSWGSAQPIPTPRYGSASGTIGGYLYVASGFDGAGAVNNVDACDPSGSTWSAKAPIPVALYRAASGVISNRLYVAGGLAPGNNNLNHLQVYDPALNSWTTRSPMPLPSSGTCGAVIGGKLFVAGGTTPDNLDVVNTLRVYDPDTDTWTTKTPMPTALDRAAAGVLGGKLYVVGGHSHSDCPGVTNVVAYDPGSDTWTPIASLPTARGNLAVGVLNEVLYAIGGETDGCGGNSRLSIVEAYDPLSQTWTALAPMPTARYLHSVATVNTTIFAIGGMGRSGAIAVNESCRQRYDFSVISGSLPQGLTLSSNGVVSGVPTDSGDFSFTVGATNAFGCVDSQTYALAVKCKNILISPTNLPDGHVATPYTQAFTATGGTAPYKYVLTKNFLPSNFVLNADTGTLTGIPLSVGTYTFTVKVTDAASCTDTRNYSIVIRPTGNPLDTNAPVLTVTSPTAKILSDPAVTFLGRAKDSTGRTKTGVAGVIYSLNGSPFQLASTTNHFTNWYVNSTLLPGWNTFIAQAFDYRGNPSTLASNIYFYGVRTSVVGMYDGLFYQTNSHGAPLNLADHSGTVYNLIVILNGKYSGRLYIGGVAYPLKGAFDLKGNSSATVSRAASGGSDLTVTMHFDWTGVSRQIRGTVSSEDEGWTSALLAIWTVTPPPNVDP
ncbi:MAG: Kelch repeat-containing protein [Limisphaerales bacterium]